MSVRVRDDNVDQPLKAHWRLVGKDEEPGAFTPKDIGTAGGMLVRSLDFEVQADSLHDGQCDRLELAVSGSFFSDAKTDPIYFEATRGEDDSDLALASWTVWEGKGPTQSDLEHIAASCPTNESLLMPAVMPMQPEMPQ